MNHGDGSFEITGKRMIQNPTQGGCFGSCLAFFDNQCCFLTRKTDTNSVILQKKASWVSCTHNQEVTSYNFNI